MSSSESLSSSRSSGSCCGRPRRALALRVWSDRVAESTEAGREGPEDCALRVLIALLCGSLSVRIVVALEEGLYSGVSRGGPAINLSNIARRVPVGDFIDVLAVEALEGGLGGSEGIGPESHRPLRIDRGGEILLVPVVICLGVLLDLFD